jgi:hypothetical protein
MEYANGKEPDGIAYRIYLEPPVYVAEVRHPDGRTLTERWRWMAEPTFGPDYEDASRGENGLGLKLSLRDKIHLRSKI